MNNAETNADPGDARPVKLGISSCLLGEKVRYDGGHELDHYLTETLGPFIDWVPVCPEVETGLGIPREPMRLVGTAREARLLTRRTHIDQTDRMLRWARGRLKELARENLSGFIFKSRSPSSGMRVNIYSEEGVSGPVGPGIWAGAFMAANPLLPVEDEGRLRDAGIRENFIERVFVYNRWQQLLVERPSTSRLVEFHSDHKYLLMAHSPSHLRELGRIVSGSGNEGTGSMKDAGKASGGRSSSGKQTASTLYATYLPQLMETLRLQATVRKNVNVLNHMMGYFKRILAADEKRELLEVIEGYHQGLTPLVVPITLIKHYVRKYDQSYLARQVYLNPHPAELMLRNHV